MIKERDFEYENNLVLLVQKGDEHSFEELYHTYYKKIYFICYEYFRDTMKAEDVTQEVFIRIHRNISKLSTVETFDVWIRKIAYNCCHTYLKKNSRDAIGNTVDMRDDKGENYIENLIVDERNIDYGIKMEQERAKEIILITLKEMKSENRLVGYLHFFEQLSYQEIVTITGQSIGTISSRIKRIKEKLRQELEKNHISKNSCFSVLLLPNIFQIYQEYAKTVYIPKHDTVPSSVIQGGNSSILHMSKLPYLLTITLAVFIPTGIVTFPYLQEAYLNNNGSASIEEIVFTKELTNERLPIEVKVSNGSYSKILLDGNDELSVEENGTHIIELYHNKELIDHKEFDVSNIDVNPPTVNEVETEDKILLQISDDNGLSYENIKMFINGSESKKFHVNRETNTIVIDKTIENQVFVSIKDIAGNKVNVDVNFYEIYR